jgi:hypothetical protein
MPTLTPTEASRLLSNLPKSAKLELNQTPAGIQLTEQRTKQQILEEKYPTLIGQPITLTEAADKYGVNRATISAWNYRSNYISPMDDTVYPALFDEAEIAYLVDIYRRRREQRSKAPLLDDNGLPYQIQHPDLAEYRRRRRDT